MITTPIIGIIGGGNMGNCLVGGLIQQEYPIKSIILADHHESHCQQIAQRWGIFTSTNNAEIARKADLLILAVKPPGIHAVITPIAAILQEKNPLVVSIAAGITLTQLSRWMGRESIPVVRAMPNMPALIGQGMTALIANKFVTPEQHQQVSLLFEAVGHILWIEQENWMNIITALSGSGPAYFYYLMENLILGATQLGLPEPIARQLTFATAMGSAYVVESSTESLTTLRAAVTSKGGTTEQALNVLEDGQWASLIQKALTKATQHSQTLSEALN